MSLAKSLPTAESPRPALSRVLLVGNPNTGKTSLFNSLSGLRARTANYPGITVDMRSAKIALPGDSKPHSIELIDLPGLYSLTPTSPEEIVAVDALRGNRLGKPAAIVLVLDATNLARNLALASEVLDLGLPTLIVLNMIDAADSSGIKIETTQLAKQLDCPVVATSVRTRQGLGDLRAMLAKLLSPDPSLVVLGARNSCAVGCDGCQFSARFDWSDSIVANTVSGTATRSEWTVRIDHVLTAPWIGTVLLATVMLGIFFCIFALADVPMGLIESGFGWLAATVDRWLPSQHVASLLWIPLVAASVALACGIAYRLGRVTWTRWSIVIAVAISVAVSLLPQEDFRSLLIDGVIGGVAGVIVFLPQICILFFCITILEDSGYMARAAFVMERFMRLVGLPGKAFVPMLSAHACAIPGIMAARTIENWRDRLVTILVLPLLTCSARLPVYAMIAALLFGDQPLYAGMMFSAAYSLGLGAALLTAWLLKKSVLTGEAAPLVIELPPYRLPSLRNALLITLDRASVFIRKAGSIILLISVILWAMASYPKLPDDRLAAAQSSSQYAQSQQALEYSLAGRAGKAMEPIFSPLGFDWKINVAVVSSFAAREVLVSTLSIVYGLGEEGAEDDAGLTETMRRQTRADGSPVFTTATCVSLLVFYVLAMQCLPTQAVTRRETGSWKWAVFQFGYMTLLAYGSAWVAYHGCIAAGWG